MSYRFVVGVISPALSLPLGPFMMSPVGRELGRRKNMIISETASVLSFIISLHIYSVTRRMLFFHR